MRGRVLAGAVVAVALVAAVLSLRGSVEPTVASTATPEPPPPTSAVAPQRLPVRPAMRDVAWKLYEVPSRTASAEVDPEHVVLLRTDDPAGPRSTGTLVVRSRDGSGLETDYRPVAGWEPTAWLIMNGALYVVEVQLVDGNGQGSRLMRVDVATGRAEQIPVDIVQRIAPSLLAVGDELISTGISTKNPAEFCAIAIRPSTGQQRIVACGIVQPIIEPADGGVLVKLPDNSPDGCSVRLLLPGMGDYGMPVFVGYCQQRQIIPLGSWQAYHLRGRYPAQPLLVSQHDRQLMLGSVKIAAVACHGRLYWVAGGRRESPYGVEVQSWTPGAAEVEVLHREPGPSELGRPSCTDGTLTVPVRSSPADGSQLVALRVLDYRP